MPESITDWLENHAQLCEADDSPEEAARCREAAAEIVALREDAARYRELRQRCDGSFIDGVLVNLRVGNRIANLAPSAGERLDAAIDAARKGE